MAVKILETICTLETTVIVCDECGQELSIPKTET